MRSRDYIKSLMCIVCRHSLYMLDYIIVYYYVTHHIITCSYSGIWTTLRSGGSNSGELTISHSNTCDTCMSEYMENSMSLP